MGTLGPMRTTPSRRRLALLAGLALVGASPRASAAEPRPTWDPTTTWALFVGVLEWQKPGLGSFPETGRVDRVLARTLVDRGVPAYHVTFLSNQAATLAACREALKRTAAAVGKDGTLVVYYAGHGLREGTSTWFAPYDVDAKNPAATGWSMEDIGASLRENTRAARVLLLGDCCHSGALRSVVERFEGAPTAAACLSSACASSTSTGRWTFTESLVSIFAPDGAADTNDDDVIDFEEANGRIHRAMRYRELQWTKAAMTSSFPASLALARVDPARRRPPRGPGPWQVGDHGQVEWRESWWAGQLVEVTAERLKVHYEGYGSTSDEWVKPSRFRRYPTLPYAIGAPVSVEIKGKRWPATVREIDVEFALVRYDGYEPDADEWVPEPRIRPKP